MESISSNFELEHWFIKLLLTIIIIINILLLKFSLKTFDKTRTEDKSIFLRRIRTEYSNELDENPYFA